MDRETKICARSKCKHQGEPQPLDQFVSRSNFDLQKKTKHCQDCRDSYKHKTSARYAETDTVNAKLQTLLQRKWSLL